MSEKIPKLIWGLFAGRCAICKKSLIHEDEGNERSLIGEIAHIVGEKTVAARGASSMSVAERNDPANLMLLCREHHKIIDDNPEIYDVERLRGLRINYLSWLHDQLTPARRWRLNVHAFSFLNVTRLGEYAQRHGFHIAHPGPPAGQSLHEMGYALNALTGAFGRTLEAIFFNSVPAEKIAFAHEDYVGQLMSFDRVRFRTRNLPRYRPTGGLPFPFTGDLKQDPHIYRDFDAWKLVLNVDPNWITTTTAYELFRPSGGQTVFNGLARITGVDLELGIMTATALVLGQPDGLPSKVPLQPPATFDLAMLEDEITCSRGEAWRGDLERCDFCGESFAQAQYMVDGPIKSEGPWGCMCADCYTVGRLPLGVGRGQLYRRDDETWRLVGGYARPLEDDEFG